MTNDLYGHEMNWAWRLFGFVHIGLLAAMILGFKYWVDFFPVIPNNRTRLAIEISSWVIGIEIAILATGLVTLFGLPEGEQWVLTKWGSTFLIAGAIVSSGLEGAVKRATTATNP